MARPLHSLPPGTRFKLADNPYRPVTGRLEYVSPHMSRAVVTLDKPSEYVHYETRDGRTVEFERTSGRRTSVSAFTPVEIET